MKGVSDELPSHSASQKLGIPAFFLCLVLCENGLLSILVAVEEISITMEKEAYQKCGMHSERYIQNCIHK